jgi:YidC/Oxa1 family membrane protein insertase
VESLALLWNEGILRPMVNSLVLLYALVGHNLGVAIILFTIIIRLVTFPLTLKQLKQSKAMADLQPKLAEIQKRYAKDPRKRSEETMRLYRQAGVNPLGCLGPLLIQFPIWIGLYQTLVEAVPSTPDSLLALSKRLYPWLPLLHQQIPLDNRFLWLNLGTPDPTPFLPLLVGLSMWVQQKMSTYPTPDPRQQQMNQMLLWMMPFMFILFTFQFPSGLALYWVVSNVVGIVMQYFITGWGGLEELWKRRPTESPAPQQAHPSPSGGGTRAGEGQGKPPHSP